jgi:hypothetical protein
MKRTSGPREEIAEFKGFEKGICMPHFSLSPYSFAFGGCAFARIGSIFVAFMTFPLTFNFPLINRFCAFALPDTIFPKFSSLKLSVTSAFFPAGASPLATSPVSLRSMCQAASSPEGFLSLKQKIAAPALMAEARSVGEEREAAMRSKAAEEGNASVG